MKQTARHQQSACRFCQPCLYCRLERKGFTLRALSMFVPDTALAEEHYKDLSSKPFFNDLVNYICSGPVVAM